MQALVRRHEESLAAYCDLRGCQGVSPDCTILYTPIAPSPAAELCCCLLVSSLLSLMSSLSCSDCPTDVVVNGIVPIVVTGLVVEAVLVVVVVVAGLVVVVVLVAGLAEVLVLAVAWSSTELLAITS